MTIYTDIGSLSKLGEIIKSFGVHRVLVVTGRKSFQDCGAKAVLNDCLQGYQVTYFSDFEVNPRLIDAKRGTDLAIENTIELIISIGGGSVLDMGKLIKAFYSESEYHAEIAKGTRRVINPNIPIIAVPTTAGSGSESTHFAVVYIEERKYSLADSCLLPDVVILDGDLVSSASRYQKACNVLDAMSQSIESAWAVGSTPRSQELAFSALELCMSNFEKYVNETNDGSVSQAMIAASNMAGQAINISKTTAAHAWSYGFSSYHGISHGHAVWMTLPAIFDIHDRLDNEELNEARGKLYLQETMRKLKRTMGINADEENSEYFMRMLSSIGIKANMKNDLKLTLEQRTVLAEGVNHERMKNNPVSFSDHDVSQIFGLSQKV